MTYTITGKEPKDVIDWVAVGRPEEIVIPEGHAEPINFVNILGSKFDPIIIHGGTVTVPINLSFGVKFDNSRFFLFTGTRVVGGNLGVSCDKKTSDFELAHLEVSFSGFCPIMCKDDGSQRGAFTMENVSIHHCTVHDSGQTKHADGEYKGEGMYIGSTAPNGHDLRNISIFNNVIFNTKWDGLQLGQGVEGCEIFNNVISNFGTANKEPQNNGLQIGNRTGGKCYNNTIKRGSGNGIIVLGDATNEIYDNKILEVGGNGIFCDDRESVGKGFNFTRNIIVSPGLDCIKIMANRGLLNSIHHNRLIRPGSFGVPKRDAFINKSPDSLVDDYENQRSMDEALASFLIAKYS